MKKSAWSFSTEVCLLDATCSVVCSSAQPDLGAVQWKAEDADFHLRRDQSTWNFLQVPCYLYLIVAGFLLKVQSRTQGEPVSLLRVRFISPYLSQPKHRYLILRQLSMLPL